MSQGSSPSPDPLDISIAQFRHWVCGFILQTLVYGINVSVSLSTVWILAVHIIKGCSTHRFHKSHLTQNGALMLYAVVMFALSTVFMGHQGMLASEAWSHFFQPPLLSQCSVDGVQIVCNGWLEAILADLFSHRIGFLRTCTAIAILVNWGTIGLLLWRAYVHWKIHSIFPIEIMVLPFLFFAACIATDFVHMVQASNSPTTLFRGTNWALIAWAMSTALYYLLAVLISLRVVYHRHMIQKAVGTEDVNKFAGYLSIFYDSGILILPFATVYAVMMAYFPNLIFLFQSMVTQMQVLLSLLIVQRLSHGRAWTGKTIDCVMNSSRRKVKQEGGSKHIAEEVTTMGFNPNTQLSTTQNDDDDASERSDKIDRRGFTSGLREVVRDSV